MSSVSPALQHALAASSESDLLTSHLSALFSSYPPPFIFVHDHQNPRITTHSIRSLLDSLPELLADNVNFRWAGLNAVACFSPRILFDTALNALAGFTPDWKDSAQNWQPPTGLQGRRYNENLDAFVHGVQAIAAYDPQSAEDGKGKGKAWASQHNHSRMVLMVERAERLKDHLLELIVPLTRLAELSQVDITTIFVSDVRWQDIRPPLRPSPEPYYIDVPVLPKQATLELLSSSFFPPSGSASQVVHPDTYHPALKTLYSHFITTLYSICSPFTLDLLELAYIAASRWPGFVQPVLDAQRHVHEDGKDDSDGEVGNIANIHPPSEDMRLRLMRLFTPSLTAALEALYPRLSNAAQWARTHAPPANLLNVPPGSALEALAAQTTTNAHRLNVSNSVSESGVDGLPRMAKFVLIAAFLASTNPARSDIRMFGRGPDERAKRRRRKMGTPRKPKQGTTGAVKIPQRLLGPTALPLDRLIAILGVLLEENDADVRPVASQYTLPGEYTEMEIARTAVYASIMELASMRLLIRASPTDKDKLDVTPMFKCGIGYELATKLARGVGIVLSDLLYEVA